VHLVIKISRSSDGGLNGRCVQNIYQKVRNVMTKVTLYSGNHFNGWHKEFKSDDGDLRNNYKPYADNWNDEASSIKVEDGSAKLYEHTGYEGRWLYLHPGEYDVSFLNHWDMNNQISSIDIL